MVLDLLAINTNVTINNNTPIAPPIMYIVFISVVSDEVSVEGPMEGPMEGPVV